MSNNAIYVEEAPGVEWGVCTAEHPWIDQGEGKWLPRDVPTVEASAPTIRVAHPDAVLVDRATYTGFYKCPHCPAGFIADLGRPDEGDEFTGQLFDMRGEF